MEEEKEQEILEENETSKEEILEENETSKEEILEEEKENSKKAQEDTKKTLDNNPNQETGNKNPNNSKKPNGKIRLTAILLLILIIVVAVVSVVVPPLLKKDEKTIATDKQEVKSKYRMSDNKLQDFDISFLKLDNNEKNIVYSPLSIKYSLEMLAEGSNGTTKEQIKAILGDYKPVKYENNDNMSFANAVFIRQQYKTKVKDSYTKNLVDKYYAEVIYDSFEKADSMNSWVKNKTFGLIDGLLSDEDVKDSNFFLINALAIDMEWNKKIQADSSKDNYVVTYMHEKYNDYISAIYDNNFDELKFDNDKISVDALKIGASINNYDIVNELGEENIRATITKEYNEWLTKGGCGNDLDTETFVAKFIKELDSNYKSVEASTDFEFHVDENAKLFAKDLKTYGNTTLQYIGIMPQNVALKEYIDSIDAKELNKQINKLKKVELNNFKKGKVTKIVGHIPIFKMEYELQLKEDLQKLNVKDVFDKDKADLSGIISSEKEYIEKAAHKANIEFSNEGIKASAATMFGGAGSAGCGFEHLYEVPVETIDLTFDKPYMFLIRDKNTKEVWFTGAVYEPTLHK